MAQETPNYGLTLFDPNDKPTWQGDWNETMTKLDSTLHEIAEGGGGGSVVIAQTTGDSTTAVMSQNAVTEALNDKVNTSEIVQEIDSSEPSATNIPSEAAVAAAITSNKNTILVNQTSITQSISENFTILDNLDLTQSSSSKILLCNFRVFSSSITNFEVKLNNTTASTSTTVYSAFPPSSNELHNHTVLIIVPSGSAYTLSIKQSSASINTYQCVELS